MITMRRTLSLYLGDLDTERKLLPFGRMLCHGIACRTGDMKLPARKLHLDGDPNRIVTLRHPAFMGGQEFASQFIGVPVTLLHPEDTVTTENAKEHTAGVILGSDALGDSIKVSMQIHDGDAINDIVSGKREALSVGYLTDIIGRGNDIWEPTGPAVNHLAVVDRGVCGERCRIFNSAESEPSGETVIRSFLGDLSTQIAAAVGG